MVSDEETSEQQEPVPDLFVPPQEGFIEKLAEDPKKNLPIITRHLEAVTPAIKEGFDKVPIKDSAGITDEQIGFVSRSLAVALWLNEEYLGISDNTLGVEIHQVLSGRAEIPGYINPHEFPVLHPTIRISGAEFASLFCMVAKKDRESRLYTFGYICDLIGVEAYHYWQFMNYPNTLLETFRAGHLRGDFHENEASEKASKVHARNVRVEGMVLAKNVEYVREFLHKSE